MKKKNQTQELLKFTKPESIIKKERGPYKCTKGRTCFLCGTTSTPEWRKGPNKEVSQVIKLLSLPK